ncbi:MAG: hypothetical protein E6J88_17800 [Deltaproteobacteria bacterium]|nr:MAG: hypothetical protein E6J88_17800 [Deltaproteobacteria bacterium]
MRALLATALLVTAPALARESRLPLQSGLQPIERAPRWGFGFMLGDPTGLTLKRYMGRNAFDAYLGFWAPGLRFGADYLWNLGRLANSPKVELDIYAGGGGFAGALSGPCGPGFITCGGGAAYVGARMPLGAELLLKEAPFTFGVEIAPGLAAGNFGLGFILDFLLIARILF